MPKAPSEFVGEYIRRTPKRVTAMRIGGPGPC